MSSQLINTGVFSVTTALSSLEVFNPLPAQFEMKKKPRYLEQTDFQGWWEKPPVNFVLVKGQGSRGGGRVFAFESLP